MIYKFIIAFAVLLVAISAAGFLLFPAQMLAVVDISSTPQLDFLARSIGAVQAALLPGLWASREFPASPVSRAVLLGAAGYMFLSSAVDFLAYTQILVNSASIPSMIFRTALGLALLALALKAMPKNLPET